MTRCPLRLFLLLILLVLIARPFHWNEEHLLQLFRIHTCCSQLLNHRHLLRFVLFTRHELFRDEVTLCSHPAAVGITSRFRHIPFCHTAASFSNCTCRNELESTLLRY